MTNSYSHTSSPRAAERRGRDFQTMLNTFCRPRMYIFTVGTKGTPNMRIKETVPTLGKVYFFPLQRHQCIIVRSRLRMIMIDMHLFFDTSNFFQIAHTHLQLGGVWMRVLRVMTYFLTSMHLSVKKIILKEHWLVGMSGQYFDNS